MKVLTINTMLNITSVGFVNSEDLSESFVQLSGSDENQVEDLLVAVNKLFETSSQSLNCIDRIVVVNGVGSFTSSRLAITIAKIISLVNGTEIFAINTHDLMFQYSIDQKKINSEDNSKKIVILSTTKGKSDFYYVKIFDSNNDLCKKDPKISYFSNREVEDILSNNNDYTVITDAHSKVKEVFNFPNMVVICDFNDIHFTMFKISLGIDCCKLSDLKPLYMKPILLRTFSGETREE